MPATWASAHRPLPGDSAYGSHLNLSHSFTRHTFSVFQSCVSCVEEYVCSVIQQFLLTFFFNLLNSWHDLGTVCGTKPPRLSSSACSRLRWARERETSVSLIPSVELIKNCVYSFCSFWNSEGFMWSAFFSLFLRCYVLWATALPPLTVQNFMERCKPVLFPRSSQFHTPGF